MDLTDYFASFPERGASFPWERGRTPERVEHGVSFDQRRSSSRVSSASSARSMIDERLEWAHQDRMRSASREQSVPASPFQKCSPFYAEHATQHDDVPLQSKKYPCHCCPKKPKEFETEEDLRYALTVLRHARGPLTKRVQYA